MTTLQTLINNCESHLGDNANATWKTADIEQWCRDAIADYSLHFPQVLSQTINAAAVYEYNLVAGFKDAISIEYPDGDDPPTFLQWKDRLDNDFYGAQGYYDIIKKGSAAVSAIVTSEKIGATGDDLIVLYSATHDNTIGSLSSLTIPDDHLHIIRNYVLWQAAVQLMLIEEANPTSNSSLLMSQYAINVDRARRAYVDILAKALYATSKSVIISWQDKAPESTRIY